MKPLIKQLLRESLLQKEEQLEEGYFKSMLAGLLMMTGLSWGQIKPEYKAKIDSIQKIETLTPLEKRAEIKKIMLANRDEMLKASQASKSNNPTYGTPEQRVAAEEKRKENRTKIFNNFVNGAYYAEGCVEEIDDEEYASGCKIVDNEGLSYIEGKTPEIPDYVYREFKDGTKIKINLNKFQKIIKKQGKADDVAMDNLQGPDFSHTSCGISKAGARQAKKDWKKK
jgi:hypothetical protein